MEKGLFALLLWCFGFGFLFDDLRSHFLEKSPPAKGLSQLRGADSDPLVSPDPYIRIGHMDAFAYELYSLDHTAIQTVSTFPPGAVLVSIVFRLSTVLFTVTAGAVPSLVSFNAQKRTGFVANLSFRPRRSPVPILSVLLVWPVVRSASTRVTVLKAIVEAPVDALDMVRFSVIAAPEISVPVILMLPDVEALKVAIMFRGTSG